MNTAIPLALPQPQATFIWYSSSLFQRTAGICIHFAGKLHCSTNHNILGTILSCNSLNRTIMYRVSQYCDKYASVGVLVVLMYLPPSLPTIHPILQSV